MPEERGTNVQATKAEERDGREAPAERPGGFIWHELSTTDPEAARSFYGRVLGWSTLAFDGEGPPYWIWTPPDDPHGGRGRGGLRELPEDARSEGARPSWMGYVWTEDVDRDVERAGALGAAVVSAPYSLPGVGRMATVRDPQGAVLILMTPDPPETEDAAPDARRDGEGVRFKWHELTTTDLDAAVDFYFELFGWSETRTFDMGPMGPYRIYGIDGLELGGMFAEPGDAPPAWTYYAQVSDLDETVASVREAGGTVTHGPAEVPGGRIAHCLDPQGAAFGLHEEV